jgi:LSD1 subclass zinc finger protein
MAIDTEKMSGAESLRKTRTYGKVRCHNPSCMERLQPPAGADHIKCPTCGMEYRIFWVNSNLPRIRGPVWDVNRKLAEAKLAKTNKSNSNKAAKKGGD